MATSGRRILLAVQPGILEGALASLLSNGSRGDVVALAHGGGEASGGYDAAVVSDELPDGVRADVVITLPDTRGSAGTGTVRLGGAEHSVSIAGAEGVIELLDQYLPRPGA